jgi:CRP-like cAMP-binding protein
VSDSQIPVLLSSFSPFDDLNENYRERIAEHAEVITLNKGKLIFQRGKEAPHRYYLLEGSVDLVDSSFNPTTVAANSGSARLTLDDSSPTRVSAVAATSAKLLKVDAEFLDVALAWSQSSGGVEMPETLPSANDDVELGEVNLSQAHVEVEEDEGDWMSTLLQSPLFYKVSPAHLQNLFVRFQRIPVKTGDVIIKEGEAGDYFYVIGSGSARVTNLTGKLDVKLEHGQFFGEEALVGDAPRNATITMLTEGYLMRLEKADFKSLLQEPVQKFVQFDELQSLPDAAYQLLDVRLPMEYRHQHVPGSRNINLTSLRDKLAELDASVRYIVTDDAGRRSQVAAYLMCQQGFDAVILEGADQHYSS